MEANRTNLPQRVTRSNLCHNKCLLRLSIFSMMISTIAMVFVSALYWIWKYRLPTATYDTILLISIVIIYVVSVINSVVIILTIDQKEVYNINRPTQGNVSSNVNDPQPELVDQASSPIVHRVRFGDFTPTNYAQERTRSVSERALSPPRPSSSSTSKEEASFDYLRPDQEKLNKSQLIPASSEINEVVPPHQLLPNNSETVAKSSIQNESDIYREPRTYTSSQIEPIYEHVWFTRNSPLNIKSNVSKFQNSNVEKIDVSQVLKKNGDFSELNNSQQIITPRKTPVRNISFPKSIAQRIGLKRTPPDTGNITPHSFASDSSLSTSFAVTSKETSQHPSSNSNLTSSSAVSPYQDHADPSSASSWSTNRSIPLASSSNLYTPSLRRELRSATNETSFSSVSPKTMISRCEPQINESISKLQTSSKIQDFCTGTKETSFSSISPKTIISSRSEPQINSVIPKSTCSNLHTNLKRQEICTFTNETFSSLSPKHHDNSSLVSSNQDYVNMSPVSQLPKNRSFPSTSISNPYISSTTQEQRQPTIFTSFSSVSPKTSTIYEISPVHRRVITTPYIMIPSYSERVLRGASPQFSHTPRVLINGKSEPHLFEHRYKVKHEPEKDDPDQKSVQKR